MRCDQILTGLNAKSIVSHVASGRWLVWRASPEPLARKVREASLRK